MTASICDCNFIILISKRNKSSKYYISVWISTKSVLVSDKSWDFQTMVKIENFLALGGQVDDLAAVIHEVNDGGSWNIMNFWRCLSKKCQK